MSKFVESIKNAVVDFLSLVLLFVILVVPIATTICLYQFLAPTDFWYAVVAAIVSVVVGVVVFIAEVLILILAPD